MPANTESPSAEAEHDRLLKLASELRCLVCQNQTIADSNSGLAIDLRGQIREQIHAGKSDASIKQYMVERYGDFVLYNPPFSVGNALLWSGPFILLIVGMWLVIRAVRRRSRESALAEKVAPKQNTPVASEQEIEARYLKDSGK